MRTAIMAGALAAAAMVLGPAMGDGTCVVRVPMRIERTIAVRAAA